MKQVRQSKKCASKDANFRLPTDLTETIRKAVESLPSDFKTDWLKAQAFSKFVSSDTAPPEVRRNAAIRKWLAQEANNEATNDRLVTVSGGYHILPRITYDRFMSTVRRIVLSILGTETVPDSALIGGFSGGASTSKVRTESHPARKYIGKADVTARALELAETVIGDSPLWSEFRRGEQLSTVEGNVLFTVPKTTEIDRVACKEPDLNMYLQKGVGDYIRSRLRLVGIDLNNQSRNQNLARQGSLNGDLATIDLSSASDSVTTELVFQSLPILWFTHLDSIRSPITFIDGERHVNEMFSSMGNGFTFELESLLFYSIAKAVCYHMGISGVVSVYGDDIIVPTDAADYLMIALSFLGFTVNDDKSFTEGPFRESCGGHYYGGVDVTPFYIKAPVLTLVDAIHAANLIRRWSDTGWTILRDDLEDLWHEIASQVPKCFWGGIDTSDKSRLVSYWRPSNPKRLIPRKGRDVELGDGGYLLWLDTSERRIATQETASLQTSKEARVKHAYRAKPYKFDARWQGGVFLSETSPISPVQTGRPG